MDFPDSYYLAVAKALAECQQVELQLKLYISNALELRDKKPSSPLPFKMTSSVQASAKERLHKAPLGELTGYFEKLSNSSSLVAELRTFAEKRNHLAHRAISECIDPDGELDWGAASMSLTEVEQTKKEAIHIGNEIHEAALPWIAHYYFDIEDEDNA